MSEVILHLHIPKVGGSTIRGILFQQCASEDKSVDEGDLFRSGIYYYPGGVVAPPDTTIPEPVRRALGRDDLRAVVGHFSFGIHPYVTQPSTYITLLRDPADRLVSLYFLLVRLPDRYDFARGTGFQDFVTSDKYREAYNDQTRRIAGIEPGLGGGGRAVLEQAKENLRRHFSLVGTMERFDETLVLLKRRFRWEKDIGYYPERQNPTRPRVAALPHSVLAEIRERNALDYELYEFANAMLEEEVTSAGPEFRRDVEALRTAQLADYELMGWRKEKERRLAREAAIQSRIQVP